MNNIDVINIKEVLEFRKNPRPVFQLGGEIQVSEIENSTDEQLNNLLEAYKSAQIPGIRKMVDEIFEKFGEENSNIIILSGAYYSDDGRSVYEVTDPLYSIKFNKHAYNKLYYPIGENWTKKTWDGSGVHDKHWDEYYLYVEELYDKCASSGIVESAEEYYKEDNEALNEFWYGCIGIMKDYKVVSFVIRNDGILCTENGIDYYTNKIITQL